ncbi:MAG: hypothetical protein PHW87_00690 [Methanothrix sp.]|nr:hypothetical protein [Methanothrix sp.]
MSALALDISQPVQKSDAPSMTEAFMLSQTWMMGSRGISTTTV